MMEDTIPFQVTLERQQHRRLKAFAERSGRSMGAVVRESVEAYLASLPAEDDPLFGLIGLFRGDGPTPHGDVAINHDAYLADIHESEVRGQVQGADPPEPEGAGTEAR